MKMRNLFLLILTIAKLSVLYGQDIPLTELKGIYRLNSIDSAYFRLKEIDGFVGKLDFDSVKSIYIITGKIGQSFLQAQLFKERIKIELTITDKSIYQKIYAVAQASFLKEKKYARGSKNLTRYNHVFIDGDEMSERDLWFILTECYRGNKPAFYEVTLRRYPYNDTD
jgi:hypothetical protein